MTDYAGFANRYVGAYQTAIRYDLKDAATVWSNSEINRAIEKAVADLTRHYPDEDVYETTLSFTITDEHFTTGVAHGTYVSLAHSPIEPGSETVRTTTNVTKYTRDTDYTINYFDGKITTISGGAMVVATAYHISYTKSRLGLNVSSIIGDMLRVSRVEYPADKVPQQFVSFAIWNGFMYVGSQKQGSSQERMSSGEHIAIYYEKPHTMPAASTNPSYPAFLDEVICQGADAYCLLDKAEQYEQQAGTDLASIAAIHSSIGTAHTALGTALAAVTTHLSAATVAIDAAVAAAASALSSAGSASPTDANTAAAAANTILDTLPTTYDIDVATIGAEALLTAGTAKIDVLNIGQNVAENYISYANARLSAAKTRVEVAIGYVQEATARVAAMGLYVGAGQVSAQAGGVDAAAAAQCVNEAATAVAHGQVIVQQIRDYIDQIGAYQVSVERDIVLADKFRADARDRLADFITILKDKAEYRKRISSVPVTQPK